MASIVLENYRVKLYSCIRVSPLTIKFLFFRNCF